MSLRKYKDLTPIALPQGPPEKSAVDYHQAKILDYLIKKYPNWDAARTTPQMLLEAARHEYSVVTEKLAEKRDVQKIRRKEMDDKWEALREQELALRNSFIRFNKIIRENRDKRDRANEKIEEGLKNTNEKIKEAEEIKKTVAQLEDVKADLEKQVTIFKMYENFLYEVVAVVPECDTPVEILNKYNILETQSSPISLLKVTAKTALAVRQEKDLKLLDNTKSEMVSLVEERQLVILRMNIHLANLRFRYDEAQKSVLDWGLAIEKVEEATSERQTEIVQIKHGLWSLYKKICEDKEMDMDADRGDYEGQLLVLTRALMQLKMEVKIATQRAERVAKSRQNPRKVGISHE